MDGIAPGVIRCFVCQESWATSLIKFNNPDGSTKIVYHVCSECALDVMASSSTKPDQVTYQDRPTAREMNNRRRRKR